MADSIYEVIAARYAGSAALRAAIPGGLVPGRARTDADAGGVRGAFTLLSNAPSWTTEDDFYHESGRVQFSVFAPTAGEAEAAARALCSLDPDGFDRLADVDLDGGGTVVHAVRASGPAGPTLDESEGPGGARVWMSTVDYLFHVSRSL